MLSKEERYAKLQSALCFLDDLDITEVYPVLCAPYDDDLTRFGFKRIDWAPYIWQGKNRLPKDHELLKSKRVFSIGLASVLTCLQIQPKPGAKILDMCAAPGIKSLYLQIINDKKLDLYVNDISHPRLVRLRKLFIDFNIQLPTFTNQPGQSLQNKYQPGYFDVIIIDAPCSGEGNIFAGDNEALMTWSPAKVRRLADLQRRLIITSYKLSKDTGTMIYATCTLNQHENEQAIKKSIKSQISSKTVKISDEKLPALTPGDSYRILPSKNSIGFFVANIKPTDNTES